MSVSFRWDPAKTALVDVQPWRIVYRWQGFDYAIALSTGTAEKTESGWKATGGKQAVAFQLAQTS
ncbi:hypothetical protein BH11ARM2_BH11ARM2_01170 [soil metagenome]